MPEIESRDIEPPSEVGWIREIADAVGRAALSAIPFAGGAAVEIFQYATNRGRTGRFQAWMADVSDTLNRHGVALDTLADNEGFLDAVGPATRAAVETASTEKIEALRNAVVNATVAPNTRADRHAILMNVLTGLTPTHIKLLRLFDDPRKWFTDAKIDPPNLMMGGQHAVVERAYPELAADATLLDRAVRDLDQQGLSSIALRTMMSGDGIMSRRTLGLGAELLEFITEPTA